MSFQRKEKEQKVRWAKLPKLRVTQHGTYRKTTTKFAPSGPKEYARLRIAHK